MKYVLDVQMLSEVEKGPVYIYNTEICVSGWLEEDEEEGEGWCLYIDEAARMALCSRSFTDCSSEFNSFVKHMC